MTSRRRPRSRPHVTEADDHALITGVYERYAANIAAYALRRTARADAADVVADTFLVAWRRHDEIPAEPDTLPWLYGVARRVLANQRRSRDRRGRLHDRLRSEFVEFELRSECVEETERFRRVAAALGRLSGDDAELLRLTAWEGLGPSEIAFAMGLDPSAVRQRLHRARQRLRRQLAAAGSDVEPFAPASEHLWASRPAQHHRGSAREPQWSAEDRS